MLLSISFKKINKILITREREWGVMKLWLF